MKRLFALILTVAMMLTALTSCKKVDATKDVENIKAFYKQVGDRVPNELYGELEALENRLKNQ